MSRVVARTRVFLDDAFPIQGASHGDAETYVVSDGQLVTDGKLLMMPEQFVGYTGAADKPETIMLKNNGLQCWIQRYL